MLLYDLLIKINVMQNNSYAFRILRIEFDYR